MSAPAQASTRDAVLNLLLQQGEMEAGELANQLGISVQAMRRHLRALETEGLIACSSASRGPGRPSFRWSLTGQGRDRFPDGSGRFALGLLDSMRASLPEETVRDLLNQQAKQDNRTLLGEGPLEQRLERLADLVGTRAT